MTRRETIRVYLLRLRKYKTASIYQPQLEAGNTVDHSLIALLNRVEERGRKVQFGVSSV